MKDEARGWKSRVLNLEVLCKGSVFIDVSKYVSKSSLHLPDDRVSLMTSHVRFFHDPIHLGLHETISIDHLFVVMHY